MDLATMPEEKLTLLERRHEYGDVYTYLFKPAQPIPYRAGQYAHVRLFGMPPEERAVREFSFASAPHDTEISFGVDSRSGSAYQRRLHAMKAGETAGIFKIKSHMTWPPPVVSDVVMIAGGIGVTPFRSMLRDLAYKRVSLTSTFIQVGRGPYQDELSALVAEYRAIQRDELPSTLAQTIQEHHDAHYYLAGSPGFVQTVAAALSASGITRVESDEFKGLAEY